MKRAQSGSKIAAPPLTRHRYARLIDAGILGEDDPIELVHGHLMVREPQSTPHATATDLAAEALRKAFGPEYRVRVNLPMGLGRDSEPNPDVAVVRGGARDYLADHPATAVLVVEVAFSSLRFDRSVKAALYARSNVPDYWIVNLVDRVVEVHRDPFAAPRRRPAYRTVTIARPGDTITPVAASSARIAVDDLLP